MFQEYLTHRQRLLEVAASARHAAVRGAWRPRSVAGMLLTAGAVALPSALFWLARPSVRGGTPESTGRRQPAAQAEANEPDYSLP